MKHRVPVNTCLALLVTALASCTSPLNPPRASTVPAVPTSAATTTAALPMLTATATPASQVSPARTSTSVPFPDPVGLEQLDSYTMTLRVSFKGSRNAQQVDASEYYTRSFSLNPAAQFTTIQTTDEDGKSIILLQGLIGDVQYARTGLGEPCTARAKSADIHIFNPAVLLKPIRQGKDMGKETVNGLTTHHYVMETIRNSDTEMSGEVWLADKNAYVVKYALRVKGGEAYFGQGSQGEQTLTFEVRDVGLKKAVAIPTGCLPPVTDLPAMPDATKVNRSLAALSYTTTSGVAKITAFYQARMKAMGWTLESTPSMPTQPPVSVPPIPTFPAIPTIPGLDLGKYLPTAVPTVAVPELQTGLLVFRLASEQRLVYITIQPEGTNSRVLAEIVQE